MAFVHNLFKHILSIGYEFVFKVKSSTHIRHVTLKNVSPDKNVALPFHVRKEYKQIVGMLPR